MTTASATTTKERGCPLAGLISSSVFLTIEMLQGRIASALKLLKYGLHLLVEWEKCTASARASADTKLAIHAIRSFFIRYSQQALWLGGFQKRDTRVLGDAIRRSNHWPGDGHLSFRSLLDAREAFIGISIGRLCLANNIVDERFLTWRRALDEFAKDCKSWTPGEDLAYQVLRLYDAYLAIEMKAKEQGRLADPLVWDQFNAEFGTIVSRIIQLRGAAKRPRADPYFQLSIGSVGLLCFVATRCRDPVIRRRALSTLEAGHSQDGLLNSVYVSAIARRMIEREEQGSRVTSCNDISAEARILRVSVGSDDAIAPTVQFEYAQGSQCEAIHL